MPGSSASACSQASSTCTRWRIRPNSLKYSRERRDLAAVAPVERVKRGERGERGRRVGVRHDIARGASCSLAQERGVPRACRRARPASGRGRSARCYNSRHAEFRAAEFRSAPHMKLIASLTSPYARKVRIALAEKKIEYDLIEESPWDAGNSGTQLQSAGQSAGVRARRRHDAVRLARDRRVPRYREPGVAPDSRAESPTHRRQALGSAGRRYLRRGGGDRARDQAPGGAAEPGLARAPARQGRLGRCRSWRASSATSAWCNGEAYSLADIATGCALGYLDLRHAATSTGAALSESGKLADKLGKRPSFAETAPPAR